MRTETRITRGRRLVLIVGIVLEASLVAAAGLYREVDFNQWITPTRLEASRRNPLGNKSTSRPDRMDEEAVAPEIYVSPIPGDHWPGDESKPTQGSWVKDRGSNRFVPLAR